MTRTLTRRTLLVLGTLFLGAAVPLTTLAEDPPAKPLNAEALVGAWTFRSVTKGDTKKGADDYQDFQSTFTKDTLTQVLGGMKFVYSYSLDTTKTPVEIKLEITESPFGAGVKANGIIRLEGDTLTLAYSPSGGTPTSFDPAKAGDDVRICVMKRSK